MPAVETVAGSLEPPEALPAERAADMRHPAAVIAAVGVSAADSAAAGTLVEVAAATSAAAEATAVAVTGKNC
jgi:predicted RecA/RadA family phage recombinase